MRRRRKGRELSLQSRGSRLATQHTERPVVPDPPKARFEIPWFGPAPYMDCMQDSGMVGSSQAKACICLYCPEMY